MFLFSIVFQSLSCHENNVTINIHGSENMFHFLHPHFRGEMWAAGPCFREVPPLYRLVAARGVVSWTESPREPGSGDPAGCSGGPRERMREGGRGGRCDSREDLRISSARGLLAVRWGGRTGLNMDDCTRGRYPERAATGSPWRWLEQPTGASGGTLPAQITTHLCLMSAAYSLSAFIHFTEWINHDTD